MFNWHKKESPILSMLGMGGGIGSKLFGGGGGGLVASGGNVDGLEPGNGYKYHTFTSPGIFIVENDGEVEILVVGGGGSQGPSQSGGGGAGGLAYNPLTPVTAQSYPIEVGTGGPATPSSWNNGNQSSALGIIARGGGKGGCRSPSDTGGEGPGSPGGSGGGAGSQEPSPSYTYGGTQPAQPQPAGTENYGFPGGGGSANGAPRYGGGGGGGAGGPGGQGNSSVNGPGGNGRQYPQFEGSLIGVPSLSPLNGYFAGGGGAYGLNGPAGSIGLGNGNLANSGGGGHGANIRPGKPGIVVIRYAV